MESLFNKCAATLFDIDRHKDELTVVLTDFEVDAEGKLIKRKGNKLRKKTEYE